MLPACNDHDGIVQNFRFSNRGKDEIRTNVEEKQLLRFRMYEISLGMRFDLEISSVMPKNRKVIILEMQTS